MALARVQSKSGAQQTFLSDVSTAAFSSPLTNPSLIVVSWYGDLTTTTANTPTDTAGNTYVRAVNYSGGVNIGAKVEVWYAKNTHTTASNVVRVTDNGAGVNSMVIAEEWTGADTSVPFDKSANAQDGAPSTAIDSGATATLSQANEMVMVTAVANLGSSQLSLGSGYTNLTQTFVNSPNNMGIASKVVAATTAVHGLMTTGSADWAGIVTTWKQAAAAGSTGVEELGHLSQPSGYGHSHVSV